MRVLFVIDSLNPEAGTENQLMELIQRLDRVKFEIFVACIEDGPRLRKLGPFATAMVFPLRGVFTAAGLWQCWRLHRMIQKQRIDLVHGFFHRAAIMSVLASRFTNCKAVLTSRRNLGYWHSGKTLAVTRWLNRYVTRVVANSESSKAAAMKLEGLAPERIDVLYNGVDVARFGSANRNGQAAARLGVPKGARIVGIVANYRPVKDLATFLRAAKAISETISDAAFVLVGSGELRGELGELARELGIEHKVFFSEGAGKVEDYLPDFEVGCLCSKSEGFSNAILEYMAAGLPVVATRVGGNLELVKDGENGLLVPMGDNPALAKAVIQILTDPDLRERMARRSAELAREKFDMDVCVRRHEEYYERLVETAP